MAFISASPLSLNTSSSSSSFTSATRAATRPSVAVRHAKPVNLPMPVRETVRAAQDDQTFIAVKPDGMNRALLGNIIARFEAKGFQLVGIKTLVPSRTLAETHYEALSSKPFFKDLVDFITSGPVCAMVWQGDGVVASARSMIGQTNPLDSAPGTIRGDFGLNVGRNVIHTYFKNIFSSAYLKHGYVMPLDGDGDDKDN